MLRESGVNVGGRGGVTGRLCSASGSLTLSHLYLLLVVLMAALLIIASQCIVESQIHCRVKRKHKKCTSTVTHYVPN